MKFIDDMPIVIIVVAILLNIAIGVKTGIGFSALMIRCIVVTIVFGTVSYMLAKTIKEAIEYSNLSRNNYEKIEAAEDNLSEDEDKPTLDIKVPPLGNEEFMSMGDDSDNEFIEVSPAYMGEYNQSQQG